jgi:hypothetical protein
LLDYFNYKKTLSQYTTNGDKELQDKNIKIKLSYPDNDKIKIKS